MRKILLSIGIVLVGILSSCGSKANTANAQVANAASDGTEQVKPVELTKSAFLEKVYNYEADPTTWKYEGDKPAIVDFYASWCGPCKRLAPVLDELAAEYGDKLHIYKINTEKEQELAATFQITSIPTLLFIPVGGEPQIMQGALAKDDLKEIIESFLLAE